MTDKKLKVKPMLDPAPSGRPHDWQYSMICEAKPPCVEETRPAVWKNPFVFQTVARDQYMRGTCVGQATAHCYDLLYIQLTGDFPTADDKACYQQDVIDTLGTSHDVLYPQSASAEAFYQMSRKIGNVTYPSGSEIRFACKAWIQYGTNVESQWHTDKLGTKVWKENAGFPVATTDGGLSQADAAAFAANHRAEGWAMLGDSNGNTSWDDVCNAIYNKKFVLGAIPIYENYLSVEGTDGALPDPSGAISGYHALCFYGYDNDRLYFLHSWGDWCGRYGSISYNYFRSSVYESVYLVVLDSADVKIARDKYASLLVTVKNPEGESLPATISVDGVQLGISPQKFAVVKGQTYMIEAVMDGYKPSKTFISYDSQAETVIVMEHEDNPEPEPDKTWWMRFLDWLFGLFGK